MRLGHVVHLRVTWVEVCKDPIRSVIVSGTPWLERSRLMSRLLACSTKEIVPARVTRRVPAAIVLSGRWSRWAVLGVVVAVAWRAPAIGDFR